jgi:hypothetical protein
MQDTTVKPDQEIQPQAAAAEQMCCDGKRTAVEHRKESSDGKCCSDS